MNASRIGRLLLSMAAGALIWAFATATGAQAQLAAGCACPAGSFPIAGTATCSRSPRVVVPVPAICPSNNVGSIAAGLQQQSFWGVQQMLTARRDHFQATPLDTAGSKVSGYAEGFDADGHALGYTGQSQKNNPLASPLYDAAPAAAAAPADPVYGAWVQGLGDWEHDNALSTVDAAHSNTTYTGQGGFDGMWRGVINADDALVLGVVTSWTNAHISYDGTPITVLMTGPGVGIYSQYVRGGFSTDVTTKFDFLTLDQNFAGTAPNSAISVLNAGVSGNVQYKVTGANNNFLEPTVGFSLTHTGFGGGAALNLEDAYTVRLQAGARVGTTWDVGNGVTVDGSLKALAYGDAVAQGTSVAGTGSAIPVLSPSDTGLVRGEFDSELCFNLPDNYSLTLSGQYRVGYALVGGSAGVNLRKAW
jgi:hypothetical protein